MYEQSKMVDIVLVNWNSGDQLRTCLCSLQNVNGLKAIHKIIIIDNLSIDGSAERLPSGMPLDVIWSDVNCGFGRACNIGAYAGNSEYLLFINPDAKVASTTIEEALDYIGAHPKAGVVGIQLLNDEGEVARCTASSLRPVHMIVSSLGLDKLTAGRLRTHLNESLDHRKSRSVDHVIGAFYLIRRSIFESLGGFDERFFMYFEDLDLSERVRRAGYEIHYVAELKAYHAGGGVSKQVKAARLYYSTRSRILYAYKYFRRPTAFVVSAIALTAEPIARLVQQVIKRDWRGIVETLGAYRWLWADAPHLFTNRPKLERVRRPAPSPKVRLQRAS